MEDQPWRRVPPEREGYKYTIRLKANAILQQSIAYLLTRPVGPPPNHVVRTYASFSYQAGSWDKKRRVVAKVEWHPGELYPRVGFIVTNLSSPARRVVAFYNHRGTAEQYIKEGKNAVVWTRLSCRKFQNNAVRLQLHALAYNLGNFMRTLALPPAVKQWSLTSLKEKLVKIGARIVTQTVLEPLDRQELLNVEEKALTTELDEIDDDALLAELGVEAKTAGITELRHVRPRAEVKAAEEVANRVGRQSR